MNPERLEKQLRAHPEMSAHKEYLDSLKKRSVDIVWSSEEAKDHESRFGGHPFVPNDFVWPVHKEGEYRFLGQINFAEIASPAGALPTEGLLSLFYAFDEEGEIFWGDDGYVVGYYWPSVDTLRLCTCDKIAPPLKKVALHCGVELPRHEDLRDDWPFSAKALAHLTEFEDCPADYLLGYPSFCTLAYDPTPGDDWTSLITLASNDELDWCWHDGDKLMVFIEKSKLESCDFSALKTDAG